MQITDKPKDDPVEINQEVHRCPKCRTPLVGSLDAYLGMEGRKNRSSFEYVKLTCSCGCELALVSTEDRLEWPSKNAYLYGRLLYEYEGVENARKAHKDKNLLLAGKA